MSTRRRKIIKTVLLLLVFSGIVPFVYPWGHPLLSLNEIKLPELKEIEKKLPDLPRLDSRSGKTITVYRWHDKNGNWSFGSEPPRGVKYEPITVNPDANLIQGLPLENGNNRTEKGKTTTIEVGNGNQPTPVTGYSAEDVSKIMQSAREARAAMEQRYKQEETIINEAR